MNQLKDLSLWDEDYVAALPSGEFDWLDYKASDKFTDPGWIQDMSKYISAWSNYDGGYIIFGIRDPKSGAPLVIDGGVPVSVKPKLLNWLDDVLPGLVEPSIRKITTWLIHPKNNNSQIKEGHALIVIHIPESEEAPHQAQDRKYYQRLGRKLEPLRHRAISDIIGRRKNPALRTTIIIHIGAVTESSLFWKLENVGKVLALHWKVVIKLPTQIGSTSILVKDEKVVHECNEQGQSYLEVRLNKAMGSPLFPSSDVSRSFILHPCTYQPPLKQSVQYVEVTTFADEMPPRTDVFDLQTVLRRH